MSYPRQSGGAELPMTGHVTYPPTNSANLGYTNYGTNEWLQKYEKNKI